MKRAITVALSAALFALTAQAQSLPAGFPTDSQVEAALDAYPGVAAAQSRVDAAQADRDVLRRGPYEFTLAGSYGRRDIEGEGRFRDADATLSRTIRLPHKATLDRQAGFLGVEAARSRRGAIRHEAALLLAELWHDWLEAGALVRGDRAAVEMQKAATAAVRRRIGVNNASELELDQARAAEALAAAQLADSGARLERARAVLAATFPELPSAGEPPALPEPELPAAGVQRLRDQVLLRSQRIEAATNEADRLAVVARRSRADLLPDPTVGVRLFSERGGNEVGVGVQISIPLGFGVRSATASRAAAEARAAGFEREEVLRSIHAVADADAAEVETRMAAWKSTADSAASAGSAASRAERGYRLGAIDLADLLLVQKQANEARRVEIGARAAASRARLRLLIDAAEIWVAGDSDSRAGTVRGKRTIDF